MTTLQKKTQMLNNVMSELTETVKVIYSDEPEVIDFVENKIAEKTLAIQIEILSEVIDKFKSEGEITPEIEKIKNIESFQNRVKAVSNLLDNESNLTLSYNKDLITKTFPDEIIDAYSK